MENIVKTLWRELIEKDDRTSPAEYPDMALITFDEFQAAMSAAPPVGVEVVKLEWREEEHAPNWWTAWHADARLGYEVRATHRGKVRRRIIGENWTDFDGDIDEAKSAAQADFERRIRSALVPAALARLGAAS